MGCAKTGDPPDLATGCSLQAYSDHSEPVCGAAAPASSLQLASGSLLKKNSFFFPSSTNPNPGFNTITATHVHFKL